MDIFTNIGIISSGVTFLFPFVTMKTLKIMGIGLIILGIFGLIRDLNLIR